MASTGQLGAMLQRYAQQILAYDYAALIASVYVWITHTAQTLFAGEAWDLLFGWFSRQLAATTALLSDLPAALKAWGVVTPAGSWLGMLLVPGPLVLVARVNKPEVASKAGVALPGGKAFGWVRCTGSARARARRPPSTPPSFCVPVNALSHPLCLTPRYPIGLSACPPRRTRPPLSTTGPSSCSRWAR